MDARNIEQLISDSVNLIAIDARGLGEARERAGKFLIACAVLTSFLKELECEMAKVKTMVEAQYATAINELSGNKITEKKALVAHNTNYTSVREAHEQLDAQRDWLKGYIKIFENAHLMYRQYSRE